MVKKLTFAEALDELSLHGQFPLDDDYVAQLRERLEDEKKWPEVEAIVCYQVLDMCSSELGRTTIAPVGPRNGITSLAAALAGKLDVELASTTKWPVWYVDRKEHAALSSTQPNSSCLH